MYIPHTYKWNAYILHPPHHARDPKHSGVFPGVSRVCEINTDSGGQ